MSYWNNICELQKKQTEKGVKTYGQTLEENTGMTNLERLTYLEEELIDALMYIEHLKVILDDTPIKTSVSIKVQLDRDAFKPEKAHSDDAGFDLKTPIYFTVPAASIDRLSTNLNAGMTLIDTGVHVEIPKGYVGMIKTKSGINTKRNILTEGVIDAGYTGSIKIKMYNYGCTRQMFERGDKIAQLVIIPIHECNEMTVVDSLDETERGDNGFGSTGR